jgi:hypothetical protein
VNTFIAALKTLIKYIAAWIYQPLTLFSIALPCAFTLFAPHHYVDMVLRSPQIQDFLNPWIGLTLLFSVSFLITDRLCFLYRRLFCLFRKPPRPENEGW